MDVGAYPLPSSSPPRASFVIRCIVVMMEMLLMMICGFSVDWLMTLDVIVESQDGMQSEI